MVRRKRRQEQQQIENQFNENTAQFLDEEQARFNDLDQLFRNDTASRRIQATLKRKLTAIKNQKDLSATKIQTNYRQRKARQDVIKKGVQKELNEKIETILPKATEKILKDAS
jgi:hypothetical protein